MTETEELLRDEYGLQMICNLEALTKVFPSYSNPRSLARAIREGRIAIPTLPTTRGRAIEVQRRSLAEWLDRQHEAAMQSARKDNRLSGRYRKIA